MNRINSALAAEFGPRNTTIETGFRPMPYQISKAAAQGTGATAIFATVTTAIIMVGTSLLIPYFVLMIVQEKEEKLMAMMTMMGVSSHVYANIFRSTLSCTDCLLLPPDGNALVLHCAVYHQLSLPHSLCGPHRIRRISGTGQALHAVIDATIYFHGGLGSPASLPVLLSLNDLQ